MLDFIALFIMLLLTAVAIWLVVLVGNFPGKLAREAAHPQAEAITILAWIGLFTGMLGWILALVWAKIQTPDSGTELEQRVRQLESKLAAREAAQ